MITYRHLARYPKVFQTLTGLRVAEFDAVVHDIEPRFAAAEEQRLQRPDRQRALGGGPDHALSVTDQVLLTVIWLRLDEMLQAMPELNGIIDTFEQRVQRPRERAEADTYYSGYSGKKKAHTLKSQVAVDER